MGYSLTSNAKASQKYDHKGGSSDFSAELPLRDSAGLSPGFPHYAPYIRVLAHLLWYLNGNTNGSTRQ
jgi:hypothetical protein